MRILVTGHDGYIGRALMPMLRAAGHEAIGLDAYLYLGCDFDDGEHLQAIHDDGIRMDVRDVTGAEVLGYDAVIHDVSEPPIGPRMVGILDQDAEGLAHRPVVANEDGLREAHHDLRVAVEDLDAPLDESRLELVIV